MTLWNQVRRIIWVTHYFQWSYVVKIPAGIMHLQCFILSNLVEWLGNTFSAEIHIVKALTDGGVEMVVDSSELPIILLHLKAELSS